MFLSRDSRKVKNIDFIPWSGNEKCIHPINRNLDLPIFGWTAEYKISQTADWAHVRPKEAEAWEKVAKNENCVGYFAIIDTSLGTSQANLLLPSKVFQSMPSRNSLEDAPKAVHSCVREICVENRISNLRNICAFHFQIGEHSQNKFVHKTIVLF